jgi:hypothetical protein
LVYAGEDGTGMSVSHHLLSFIFYLLSEKESTPEFPKRKGATLPLDKRSKLW